MKEFYIYPSCTWQSLFIRFYLFQSLSILAHPPAPVYSFILNPGVCRSDRGGFLALGYEDMPVQASIRY